MRTQPVTPETVKQATLCMTRQCWEQGIFAQALLEEEDYRNLDLMVYDIVLRQSADGRLCNIESAPAVVDSSFNILPVLAVAERQHNEIYKQAAQRNVDYLLHKAPRAESGLLYHMKGEAEVWADTAAFMPAVLALYGQEEEAVRQMHAILDCLRDEATELYFHKWDEGRRCFARKALWGVGNGWILTGLLRLYLCLPEEKAGLREDVLALFVPLLDRLLGIMTPEYTFHDVLDDEDTFTETECAEMVAYSIFRAMAHGLLDESYLSPALDIRRAVLERVTPEGLVTGSASSPDFVRPGTSVESQAHYLMMEAALKGLQSAKKYRVQDEKPSRL